MLRITATGWGVSKWKACGGKDNTARGQTGWRMSLTISAVTHGSGPAERVGVSQRYGRATHRLDPTQSNGCILQAAGTAAAVEAVQHRQTADFERHV
jgi:hypothetical protein